VHGRHKLVSLLLHHHIDSTVAFHSPIQHGLNVLDIARDLIRLRPMPTCSLEGDHADGLREILVCWVRQKTLSSTLRHEEGTLHELSDHDNDSAVRCDAQAQDPTAFLISSTTLTTAGTPAAPPAMGTGCQITPADDRRSGLRHAHTTHASAYTNQHLRAPAGPSPGGGVGLMY